MPFIAGNGILILIPAALFLASKARADEFDGIFYLVQALELIAGATNITLLGLNMRDGLKLTGRLRQTGSYDVPLTGRDIVADGTWRFTSSSRPVSRMSPARMSRSRCSTCRKPTPRVAPEP